MSINGRCRFRSHQSMPPACTHCAPLSQAVRAAVSNSRSHCSHWLHCAHFLVYSAVQLRSWDAFSTWLVSASGIRELVESRELKFSYREFKFSKINIPSIICSRSYVTVQSFAWQIQQDFHGHLLTDLFRWAVSHMLSKSTRTQLLVMCGKVIKCHKNLTQLVSCNLSSFPASQDVVLQKAAQNSQIYIIYACTDRSDQRAATKKSSTWVLR